jgi:hypothetical protein
MLLQPLSLSALARVFRNLAVSELNVNVSGVNHQRYRNSVDSVFAEVLADLDKIHLSFSVVRHRVFVKLYSIHMFFRFLTWIYPVFPLFIRKQQGDLSNFYYASLRRTLYCFEWNGSFFSYVFDELFLENRCVLYWNRYLHVLADSTDGILLFEKVNLAEFRKSWLNKEFSIKGLNRSKRFVFHLSILEKVLNWLSSVLSYSLVPHFDIDDVVLLQIFPGTFC